MGSERRRAGTLAATLGLEWDLALLFRRLATLRTDIVLFKDLEELRWRGPTSQFDEVAPRLDAARTNKRRTGKSTRKRATIVSSDAEL
jgi:hypothetical protein